MKMLRDRRMKRSVVELNRNEGAQFYIQYERRAECRKTEVSLLLLLKA